MIPKKETPEVDLNAELDKDIKKAEEDSKDAVKKSKPKLAQAVATKYLKYIIIIIMGIAIAYKMFFAPTPEKPKKKKNVISKTATRQEIQQKQLAEEKVSKSSIGEIDSNKTEKKQILSLENQTLSNSESLSNVSVPKLQLPTVPDVPTIDKITIQEKTNTSNNNINNAQNQQTSNNPFYPNKINNNTNTNGVNNNMYNNKEKNNYINDTRSNQDNETLNMKDVVEKKKIIRKVRKNGKLKQEIEEVFIKKDGSIVDKYNNEIQPQQNNQDNENNNTNNNKTLPINSRKNISNTPLSKQIKKQYNTEQNKNKKPKNTNIGETSLENMFIISGSGPKQKNTRRDNAKKDDFILFDGSSISIKETVANMENSNVSKLSNLENTIAAGKIMEAVLETAINSETAGTIRAVVSKDVMGEIGDKILIPKGSRLYGSYATTKTTTQSRLLLTWTKVIRPDGIVITMNADTYDQSGKKGIEGDIDTRYGELFKNSLLYSFVTLGTAVALEKLGNIKGTSQFVTGNGTIATTNVSPANAAAQSVIDTAQDIAEKMTDGLTDDLDPIISIPQGILLKIISSTDIVVGIAYKRHKHNLKID